MFRHFTRFDIKAHVAESSVVYNQTRIWRLSSIATSTLVFDVYDNLFTAVRTTAPPILVNARMFSFGITIVAYDLTSVGECGD